MVNTERNTTGEITALTSKSTTEQKEKRHMGKLSDLMRREFIVNNIDN